MKKIGLFIVILTIVVISCGCAADELKFSEPATYDYAEKEAVTTDVRIETAGVILKNMVINADIYIDESVAEGNIELHNVELNGTLHIYGEELETVYMQECKISKLIGYTNSTIKAANDTVIEEVTVQAPGVILENNNTAADAYQNVSIDIENPAEEDDPVVLNGTFEEVNVQNQSNIELTEKTQIKYLALHINGTNDKNSKNKVKINKNAVIDNLDISGAADIQNEGNINNISFGENVTDVIINGEEITFLGSENYKPQFLCKPVLSVNSSGDYSITFQTNNKGTVYYVIQPWFESESATLSAKDIEAGKGVAFSDGNNDNAGFMVASAKSVSISGANTPAAMTGYMGDKEGMRPPQGEDMVFDSVVWCVFKDDNGNYSDVVKIEYLQ